MIKAIHVIANDDYSITVSLENGQTVHFDMNFVKAESGPIVEPLKHLEGFKKVFVRNGIVCWPTGYDIDPYFLIEQASVSKTAS
jgi:hypothetical protein